ncbi:MAG: 3-isopropylmalate dehydratase small subunit [Acidobacteriota bacterium]
MSGSPERIYHISGRGIPLRGNDMDTDRIMPARYLRVVSFEGLEQHLFEDDRKTNREHPFNDPRYAGATVLVVNENFGCGSSREHAPQGLARSGIRAIVGESFSEIFLGNSSILGLPCFSADHAAVERLQSLIEATPDVVIEADVEAGIVTAGALRLTATVHQAFRDAFLSGQWNPTAMLLADFDQVRAVANHLPYVSGF